MFVHAQALRFAKGHVKVGPMDVESSALLMDGAWSKGVRKPPHRIDERSGPLMERACC